MLMFPYIANLLAAMLLGALIGAERQWRQRMAGLRTNALVATGAAVFILSSISTSPDSPGRIAAQVVSGIGFLGAGVIMRGRHERARPEYPRQPCGALRRLASCVA
ncbi:magnesium transport protein MgtC [Klebsiella michiganensis]|nr:magnesium transport protein MgtC [Klebsiella michiganensis]